MAARFTCEINALRIRVRTDKEGNVDRIGQIVLTFDASQAGIVEEINEMSDGSFISVTLDRRLQAATREEGTYDPSPRDTAV